MRSPKNGETLHILFGERFGVSEMGLEDSLHVTFG
jgi:hypothetical protein